MNSICVEYLLLSPYFQSVSVPRSEIGDNYTYGSCVCIHSASLCLLVGAFNLFTLKVIIDICDPITIFLIVLGLFSVGLFFLWCFLPTGVPLACAVKLV